MCFLLSFTLVLYQKSASPLFWAEKPIVGFVVNLLCLDPYYEFRFF